ncbi:MAG: integrase arm-type DNA-binding domain-containing protein [Candidatus Ozemobacteraceae bacterium]
MPKLAKPLTDLKCRNAKPSTKPRYLCDGAGLFLLINPNGSKLWRLKYRIGKKPGMFALGKYPDVSLDKARELRKEYLLNISAGIAPLAANRQAAAADIVRTQNTFKLVAERYFGNLSLAASSRESFTYALEKDVFPVIGHMPVQDIKRDDISALLQRIIDRGAVTTTHSTAALIARVFEYAVNDLEIIDRNPARRIKNTLPQREVKNFPAILDPKELGFLLRCIDEYRGTTVVKAALQLAPLLACRPSELRKMEWIGINLDTAEWRYTVSKVKRLHIVPLCSQVVAILRELHSLTGAGKWVFASPHETKTEQPISSNTVLNALRLMKFSQEQVVGHGFRATFQTLGIEQLKFSRDVTQMHLTHTVKDPLGRAYLRVDFLDERRVMLQRWADYLDELKAGDNTERKAGAA